MPRRPTRRQRRPATRPIYASKTQHDPVQQHGTQAARPEQPSQPRPPSTQQSNTPTQPVRRRKQNPHATEAHSPSLRPQAPQTHSHRPRNQHRETPQHLAHYDDAQLLETGSVGLDTPRSSSGIGRPLLLCIICIGVGIIISQLHNNGIHHYIGHNETAGETTSKTTSETIKLSTTENTDATKDALLTRSRAKNALPSRSRAKDKNTALTTSGNMQGKSAKTAAVRSNRNKIVRSNRNKKTSNTARALNSSTGPHANANYKARFKEGSFEIPTSMPTLPTVICDYRIPLNTGNKALQMASDIVLLFPFPTEKTAISGIAKPLSDRWGFTTISIRFPGMGPDGGISGNDTSRWYYYPESGSGQAWLDAIDRVRKIGKLKTRPVFVTGRSGGGSAAGLFADAHPDAVAAVANEAGRVFGDKATFSGPILLMYGAHDYVLPKVEAFIKTSQASQRDVIHYTYPANWERRAWGDTWQHCITKNAQAAMWRWLVDLADMRIENGDIPSREQWPHITDNVRYTSETFKTLIDKVPKASHKERINDTSIITAHPAASTKSKGTVYFAGTTFDSDIEERTLDAECLADHGWTCIAILTESKDELPSAIHAAINAHPFPTEKSKPAVLLLDAPDSALSILSTMTSGTHRWDGLIISKPRTSIIGKIALECEKQSLELTVVGPDKHLNSMKKHFAGLHEISWRSFEATNFGGWQQGRMSASIQQLKRWAFDRKNK